MTLILAEEWSTFENLPLEELTNLAAELDILAPEEIVRRELLEQCVLAIVSRAERTGLPFSKYDLEDLEELPQEYRAALARLQRLPPGASSAAIVAAGEKAYRQHYGGRKGSPVALMLPMLLRAVARAALLSSR